MMLLSFVLVGVSALATDESREEFLQRLAALAATAPPAAPLRGTCTLTGCVVSDRGEPLPGATVRAMRRRDWPRRIYSDPIVDLAPAANELAASLASFAESWWSMQDGQREATTDAEGRFAFADLAEGDYDLAAWQRGFEIVLAADAGRDAIGLRTTAMADFVATPAIRQRFDVRNADGTPATEACLQFERFGPSARPRIALWTPAEPATLLSAGDWYVVAMIHAPSRITDRDPRRAWLRSERRLVTIAPPIELDPVLLELHGVPAIEGEIVASGESESVSVVGVRLRPGQEPAPALLDDPRRFREHLPAATAQRARVQWNSVRGRHYRFDGIAPGRWYVGVSVGESEAPVATEVIDVADGCVVHDFLLPPAVDRRMLVRVLEPDGSPLRDCAFQYRTERLRDGGGSYQTSGHLYARRSGTCAFLLPTERLGARAILLAVHPRFGAASIDVVVGRTEPVIRFVEPARVTLRMPGFAENASGREVSVIVERTDDRDAIDSRPEIATDERLDLGRLQPGAYRIRVEADSDPDDRLSAREVATTTVQLDAGPCEITLPFPRLEALRIAVPASQRSTLVLRPDDEANPGVRRVERVAEPDADGIAVFRDVPPGSYVVELRQARMLVEAPARDTIRFVATPVRSLLVTVTDAAGPLARAGLRSGDRVVAIGGQEFEGSEQLTRIRASLRRDEITLTIERAGKRFQVVIAAAHFTGRDAGGTFVESLR